MPGWFPRVPHIFTNRSKRKLFKTAQQAMFKPDETIYLDICMYIIYYEKEAKRERKREGEREREREREIEREGDPYSLRSGVAMFD